MKKCLTIIFTALLTICTLTGCAGQAANRASSGPAVDQSVTPANKTSSPAPSPNASVSYEKLIAYKTDGYGKKSVADFNASLASTPDELTEFLAAQLDGLSEAEITDGDIKKMLTDKSDELADSLSTENMKLSPEIYMIEIIDE